MNIYNGKKPNFCSSSSLKQESLKGKSVYARNIPEGNGDAQEVKVFTMKIVECCMGYSDIKINLGKTLNKNGISTRISAKYIASGGKGIYEYNQTDNLDLCPQ